MRAKYGRAVTLKMVGQVTAHLRETLLKNVNFILKCLRQADTRVQMCSVLTECMSFLHYTEADIIGVHLAVKNVFERFNNFAHSSVPLYIQCWKMCASQSSGELSACSVYAKSSGTCWP